IEGSPGFGTLETVFEALGRALIVLDEEFKIIRVSQTIDEITYRGAAAEAIGKPIEDLVGAKLFGPSDSLRDSLSKGRRQEGRRAFLRCGEGSARLVSLTAAVLPRHVSNHCDPRAYYLIVLRPAEDDVSFLQTAIASHGLIARSPAMLRIVHLVESLSRSDATVLITGESGTGKEVLARALHAHSPRSAGPLIAVNCAALPGELLESELFGHVRGAFTGAVKDRVGRFELANGGSIFLDEIGDLPVHLQAKLLRVIQERKFERVGDSVSRTVDARIIAATNADLQDAIAHGRFREDLYYRLRVVPIRIPPLRERPEDIALIAPHLLAHISGRAGRSLRISQDTLAVLERYPWPGNVRELENTLEYAVTLCTGQTIQIEDLPPEVSLEAAGAGASPASSPAFVADEADPDRVRILEALSSNRWNRSLAAKALSISRSTLWRRMHELGIE
ncbi:MAG TPA: sigma 54-interacting transcriptional regulator, partial [Thermoanaerobaculia bacterium]